MPNAHAGYYLCARDAILREHGLVQAHEPALPGPSARTWVDHELVLVYVPECLSDALTHQQLVDQTLPTECYCPRGYQDNLLP